MTDLSIDQQVSFLMQGTEYGDETLKQAMATELRKRLEEVPSMGTRLSSKRWPLSCVSD
jgi:hypothetical protein